MLLAVNTSTLQFSVALLEENGTLVAEFSMAPGFKNYNGFMPAIDHLLQHSKVRATDIKAVFVAKGPGSFTGLRVGISAAKGFCQGLDIPLIGVSSLEALALQATFTACPVCPVLDSRRGEVFAALFRWDGDQEICRETEDLSFKFEDLTSLVTDKALFLGNDFIRQGPAIREILGTRALLAPSNHWTLRASSVGVVGLKRFRNRAFDNLRDLVPSYMRPPDIRPNPYSTLSDQRRE